ncbi:hypothetical protein DM01DRAFT_1331395 [Hesseltinella vesiculosa]|uniref:PA domain-containing protein n=1 Tax=Hesseltinella vesiculosa TaxID=101127 RepID=A0A1X2GV60_9FUNG|nr:hypothetical protein DM01DRAFT_1331395 [Hesseltinella vesiculosa]
MKTCVAIGILVSQWLVAVQATVRVMVTNVTYPTQLASFGPTIDDYGFLGYLHYPMESVYGCEVLSSPPAGEWIALVTRGKCSFLTKIRNMQQSGASAVIVGDRQANAWLSMDSHYDTSDIHIPSMFVPQHVLLSLLTTQQNLHRPLLVLLNSDETTRHPWHLVDSVFLLVTILPALIYICTWIYTRYYNISLSGQHDLEKSACLPDSKADPLLSNASAPLPSEKPALHSSSF